MSIETHYQRLRNAMSSAAADLAAMGDRNILAGREDLLHGVAAAATELAAETWPETRMRYAALRANMPQGPAVYSASGPGYGYGTMCGSIVSSNDDEHTLDGERRAHIDHGVRVMTERAKEDLARKSEAFERYAALVEQGVALAPSA